MDISPFQHTLYNKYFETICFIIMAAFGQYLLIFPHFPSQFPLLRMSLSLCTSLLSKRGNVLEKLVLHGVEDVIICLTVVETLLVASQEGLVQGNHNPIS